MSKLPRSIFLMLIVTIAVAVTSPAFAHCDAEDGPAIKDARLALETGNVAPMLKWVPQSDEAQIRALFDRVSEVRKAGEDARVVADALLIETFIRLHRASEGEPFDGIKPAGSIEPIVAKVDAALDQGDGEALADAVAAHVREEILLRFEKASTAAKTKDADAVAGRAWVAAYVDVVHFVKGVHDAVTGAAQHAHGDEGASR